MFLHVSGVYLAVHPVLSLPPFLSFSISADFMLKSVYLTCVCLTTSPVFSRISILILSPCCLSTSLLKLLHASLHYLLTLSLPSTKCPPLHHSDPQNPNTSMLGVSWQQYCPQIRLSTNRSLRTISCQSGVVACGTCS